MPYKFNNEKRNAYNCEWKRRNRTKMREYDARYYRANREAFCVAKEAGIPMAEARRQIAQLNEKQMSVFDPIRAINEELSGLYEVQKTLNTQAQAAQQKIDEAENLYSAMVKTKAIVDAEIARKVQVRRELEAERDKREKQV